MTVDLIQRVFYLRSKGDDEPLERLNQWLARAESVNTNEIAVDNQKYFWVVISSVEFEDIIADEHTDWLYIYSETRQFKAIGSILDSPPNLVGEKQLSISTLWILRSDIESIKISETPIKVFTPHRLQSPLHRINYDMALLLTKLKDHTIKLTELVDYKTSKSFRRYIR